MKIIPVFAAMKCARCVVCALLSARQPEPEGILTAMAGAVESAGGIVVGQLLQRRGASRSKSPGGSKRMDKPLTQRALFGSGKTVELAALASSRNANILLIYNSITEGQRKVLADLTSCRVYSFLDEIAPHLGSDPNQRKCGA